MKLPGGERAFIDVAKLYEYCLNPEHAVGKHKARVLASALNLRVEDAAGLRTAILKAAKDAEAVVGRSLEHGQLYTVDFDMEYEGARARVRTGWIVRLDEDFPRLTTCYVL